MKETDLTMHAVRKGEPGYPRRLMRYEKMPETLYYIGKLPDENRRTAAVIGARACSPYGRIQAFRYADFLSRAGVQVISGLAYGIDSEGHKGALEGPTPTFAVLGSGADVCYPKSHRTLYERIVWNQGGILSPFAPGTMPQPWHFPQRNVIISALSDIILIVEAREKSGTLSTVEAALDMSKSVYAIPGAVNDELSAGCNRLIYEGAVIAWRPEVLLDEWCLSPISPEEQKKSRPGLTEEQKLVFGALGSRPRSMDYLIRQTGLSSEKVGKYVVELCLMGCIKEVGRHYYVQA